MFLVPDFKGHDFFPHDLRFPFMRYKGICLAISFAFMAASFVLFGTMGFNYGVDFRGGSLVEVQSKSGPADIAGIRSKLEKLDIGDVQIQSFGNDTDVLIRIQEQPGGEGAQQEAMEKVLATLGDRGLSLRILPHRAARRDPGGPYPAAGRAHQ